MIMMNRALFGSFTRELANAIFPMSLENQPDGVSTSGFTMKIGLPFLLCGGAFPTDEQILGLTSKSDPLITNNLIGDRSQACYVDCTPGDRDVTYVVGPTFASGAALKAGTITWAVICSDVVGFSKGFLVGDVTDSAGGGIVRLNKTTFQSGETYTVTGCSFCFGVV